MSEGLGEWKTGSSSEIHRIGFFCFFFTEKILSIEARGEEEW